MRDISSRDTDTGETARRKRGALNEMEKSRNPRRGTGSGISCCGGHIWLCDNKKNSNMTTDMGAATRPQIAFSYNGYSLNDLPGYKNEMDLTGVRDSITPVSNGQLQVTIKAYENVIDSLDYTVYSIEWAKKSCWNKR